MTKALDPTRTITANLERILSVVMLTPMEDPNNDEDCIWGAPTMLWGPPGIGKSGRVKQAARACKLPCGVIYLSTHQPEDISGVPMADGKGGATMVCTLPQVNALVTEGRGVLFLDELTCARPAMQGAGLGVVQDRYFAGKRLPGRIRVLAAANPPEQAAGGWNLAPPMSNRLLHFDVGCPSVDEWSAWLLTGPNATVIPINEGERTVQERWPSIWPRIAGLGAGFVRKYKTVTVGKEEISTLHHLPPPGHADRGRAWASPRAWEVALRCVAAADCLGESDVSLDLLSASVGQAYAASWAEWIAYANLPDPKEVLEHGWTPDRRRLDISVAVLSSAIAYALAKTDKAEQRRYAIMAWKLLNIADQANLADIALAPGAALMRAGYTTKAGPDVDAVCRTLIGKFGASGLANYSRK